MLYMCRLLGIICQKQQRVCSQGVQQKMTRPCLEQRVVIQRSCALVLSSSSSSSGGPLNIFRTFRKRANIFSTSSSSKMSYIYNTYITYIYNRYITLRFSFRCLLSFCLRVWGRTSCMRLSLTGSGPRSSSSSSSGGPFEHLFKAFDLISNKL